MLAGGNIVAGYGMMSAVEQRLANAVTWAGDRLREHYAREAVRRRAGGRTDMDRYLAGETIVD